MHSKTTADKPVKPFLRVRGGIGIWAENTWTPEEVAEALARDQAQIAEALQAQRAPGWARRFAGVMLIGIALYFSWRMGESVFLNPSHWLSR